MSLSVAYRSLAMAPNLTQYFAGVGGTSPYSYRVAPGGAGGTINLTTGLYTSPSAYGVDQILVSDSADNVASVNVTTGSALILFCDVIQTFMGLQPGQVFLWDQKIFIPTDDKLYITVGVMSCKPFSNSNSFDSNGNQNLAVNMYALLDVNILSRGPAARDLKEQVILALNSNYAQSQQEANSFYIGKLSTAFVNLSEIDGAAIPYRFNISVALQYMATQVSAVPYFNNGFTPVSVSTNP